MKGEFVSKGVTYDFKTSEFTGHEVYIHEHFGNDANMVIVIVEKYKSTIIDKNKMF